MALDWREEVVLKGLETVRRFVEHPDPGWYDEVRQALRTLSAFVDLAEAAGARAFDQERRER